MMERTEGRFQNHIVVTGYGTKNRRAIGELMALGADVKKIVIDSDSECVQMAKALGCSVISGDASRDETLRAAHLERARLVIISAGRDDTSILICLAARHLAPNLRISMAINKQANEAAARRAGADIVVNAVEFAGLVLATSASSQHIAGYLADLASGEGKVQLIEREVEPQEIGRSLSEIEGAAGLRVIREGQPYGFWRTQAQKLQENDVIMEIRPLPEARSTAELPNT